MKNKKIAIIIVVAVVVAVGGYFGLYQLKDTVPVCEGGLGTLYPEVPAQDVAGADPVVIKPGVDYTAPFVVMCGADQDRTVRLTIEPRRLDKLPDGYIQMPEECYSWFRIAPDNYQGGEWKWDRIEYDEANWDSPLLIDAGRYRYFTIVLEMPEDTPYYGQKMAVQIQATEMYGGFNILGVAAVWYIETLPKDAESV